jgi:glycosyltransferase involved in cell wall biosynthesis
MPSPQVSVIIPTYNRGPLIEETARSVLAQSLTDLELLIVCDGCTDDTVSRLKGIGDSRLKIIERPNSGRPAPPRNEGMRHAHGRYLAFCDDDDLWDKDKLAKQVAALEANPQAALCANSEYWFNAETRWLVDPAPRTTFSSLLRRNTVSTSSVVVRADIAREVGFFDESPELRAVEDFEYWLRVIHRHPMIHLREPLSWYRVHPGGISADRLVMQRRRIAMLRTIRGKLGGSLALWTTLMQCYVKYLALQAIAAFARLGFERAAANRQIRKA